MEGDDYGKVLDLQNDIIRDQKISMKSGLDSIDPCMPDKALDTKDRLAV